MTYTIDQLRKYMEAIGDGNVSQVPTDLLGKFASCGLIRSSIDRRGIELTQRAKYLITYAEAPQFEFWLNVLRYCNEV